MSEDEIMAEPARKRGTFLMLVLGTHRLRRS